MSRFTRWMFEITDNSNFAFVIVVTVLVGFGYLMGGCSTRSIVITDGMINATSTTLLYCPEATVTRVKDGNRTVDTSGVETGVGETLKSVADAIFGGGK